MTTAILRGSIPEDNTARIVRQPETRPISAQQLIAEVKGIDILVCRLSDC